MTASSTDVKSPRLLLSAGPLTMALDTDTGFLRRMRSGDHEFVRGVYAAVRDDSWATIPRHVDILEQQVDERSFRIVLGVTSIREPVDFRWRTVVTGTTDGVVRYEMHGEAHTTFMRNRIGLCILHPIDGFAGGTCRVHHPNGTAEDIEIPKSVSPHQPAFDIRAMSYETAPDERVYLQFEGDVFEMEDQRNWSDASFKTYCTPLERPMPVRVEVGDTVHQAVTIRCEGASEAAPGVYSSSGAVHLHAEPKSTGQVPEIGTSFRGLDAENAVGFGHLFVEVDPTDSSFSADLDLAAAAARRHDATLFIAAHLPGPVSVDRLVEAAPDLPVSRWLILDADGRGTDRSVGRVAREQLPNVGGGTGRYFTQINQDRPAAQVMTFVNFSVNPQVHAFDDLSMMETLPVQATLVENARSFSDGLPVTVAPITLRPRSEGERAPGYDKRQGTLFGAAWTAGSFIYLTRAGAAAATYFDADTIGESLTGLFEILTSFQGEAAYDVHSDDEERVLAIGIGGPPRQFLVVNLTPGEQEAAFDNARIDGMSGVAPSSDAALTLPPYAWALVREKL